MPSRMDVSDASDDEAKRAREKLIASGMEPPQTAEEAIDENQTINEEYKIWKKNAPYLYDVVITHALEWPTLTCQWFPDREVPSNNKAFSNHRLLLGTHTSGQASDYLMIASLQLPKRDGLPGEENIGKDQFDEDKGELIASSTSSRPINITQRINHDSEINRARYMPQNPDLIATKNINGEVWVFDRTKHGNQPDKAGVFKPAMVLSGLTEEGFGLAWNESKAGHILSSSEDSTVAYWDIQSYTTAGSALSPITVFKGHDQCVNGVSWNPYQENIFASVGDDGLLVIWDARAGNNPVHRYQAHGGVKDKPEAMSVAYSPSNENLLLTGGSDSSIALHDMRNVGLGSTASKTGGISVSNKLHTFHAHTDEVLHIVWSPHVASVFASGSQDRRVNIWDMSQIGQEQTPDDAEDGVPELLFVHGGHMASIADLDWAPNVEDKWTLVSAGEDNVLMVWSPTWRIWASEHVPMRPGELEKGAGKNWDSDDDGEENDNDEEMGSEDEGEVDEEEGADEEPADTATPRSSVAPSEAASMRSAPKSVRDPMDED